MATKSDVYVHQSSFVDDGCEIGSGTKIWHFCHVTTGSKLGERCVLGQNVYVGKNAIIGNNVKIQNNVSVYEGVIIEDDVFCGPSMVFTNVINPRSHIERKQEFRQTLIKKGVTLGANCTVVCGAVIGQYAFVAAGAVVRGHIPAHALMMGVPAIQKGWVCACGVRLEDAVKSGLKCRVCGLTYELTEEGLVATNEKS